MSQGLAHVPKTTLATVPNLFRVGTDYNSGIDHVRRAFGGILGPTTTQKISRHGVGATVIPPGAMRQTLRGLDSKNYGTFFTHKFTWANPWTNRVVHDEHTYFLPAKQGAELMHESLGNPSRMYQGDFSRSIGNLPLTRARLNS